MLTIFNMSCISHSSYRCKVGVVWYDGFLCAGCFGSQWFAFYQWCNLPWTDWDYIKGDRKKNLQNCVSFSESWLTLTLWVAIYQLKDEHGQLMGVDTSNLLISNSGNDLPVRKCYFLFLLCSFTYWMMILL